MKKLALFSLLALTLSVASAKPPVEGDVLEGNDFVLGVDISGALVQRVGGTEVPYLLGNSINPQFVPISSPIKAESLNQLNALANVNFRYGLFNYVEFFVNGNGYYQASSPRESDDVTSKISFANANIGLMIALYKSDTFSFILGDNSDVISNVAFDNSDSHMNYFKGHTFFLNMVQKGEGEKGFFSSVLQLYYRMNLTQSYKDMSFRNGDEYGVSALMQFGREKFLGFMGFKLATKDSDVLDGTRLHSKHSGSFGTGITVGTKYDFNNHFGMKVSVDYMTYALDYNSNNADITLGFYVK